MSPVKKEHPAGRRLDISVRMLESCKGGVWCLATRAAEDTHHHRHRRGLSSMHAGPRLSAAEAQWTLPSHLSLGPFLTPAAVQGKQRRVASVGCICGKCVAFGLNWMGEGANRAPYNIRIQATTRLEGNAMADKCNSSSPQPKIWI